MPDIPNRVVADSNFATAWNKNREAARSHVPGQGVGVLTSHTVLGTTHEAQSTAVYAPDELPPHPFKITHSTDWLTVQVAPGYVIAADDPIAATGVDADIVLAEDDAQYWLYLDIDSGAGTASVEKSATTPAWSCAIVPIGWVDTLAGAEATPPYSIIYQFLHENIFSPTA